MLRNASIICNGNMPIEDVIFQANHYSIMLTPGAIPHTMGKKALAYGQPTIRDNTWTQWLDTFGWDKWIMQEQNDGLFVDTPFLHYDSARLLDIAAKIAPKPLVPNYGDYWTWSRKAPAAPGYGAMAEELEQHFTWAWVQNALDMQFFTPKLWRDLRSAANVRLAAGRTLILGIYDPGRKHEQLAALLSQSFEHPRLFWAYNTDKDSVATADQWNNQWEWSR